MSALEVDVVLFALMSAAPAQTPPAPEVPPCTVMVPVLTIDGMVRDVGMMYATQVGDQRVFVTAHSLFGPAGGFAAPIPASELAVRVTKLVARDAYETNTECGFSTKVVPVPDAVPMADIKDGSRDLAVFVVGVPEKGKERKKAEAMPPLVTLPFAEQAPAVGDVVYVLAPHAGKTERIAAGKVVEVAAGSLYFQYDDASIDVTGTVGAPVVNAARQVVGLNLASGKMDDGSLIGSASPLAGLRQRVEAAAK